MIFHEKKAPQASGNTVVKLIEKYSNVPTGFADACLVRLTETLADPSCSLPTKISEFTVATAVNWFPCVTPE